jgi:predicted AlkP superfamily phosphohydrolase/phosphomutase
MIDDSGLCGKMGFLDKAINSVNAAIDTSSSKLDETIEVEKLESKIREEKKIIDNLYIEIGVEYYNNSKEKSKDHKTKMDEDIVKIDEAKKIIDELQAKIEDLKAKEKEKRDNIRAEKDAKNKAIDEGDGRY